MSDNRKTIRDIDDEIFLQARVYALQSGRTLGQLVSESLMFFIEEAEDPLWEGSGEDFQ